MSNKKGFVANWFGALIVLVIAVNVLVGCVQPTGVDNLSQYLNNMVPKYEKEAKNSMTSFESLLNTYNGDDKTTIKEPFDKLKTLNPDQWSPMISVPFSQAVNNCTDKNIKDAGTQFFNDGMKLVELKSYQISLNKIKQPLSETKQVINEHGDEDIKNTFNNLKNEYYEYFKFMIDGIIKTKPSLQQIEQIQNKVKTAQDNFTTALENNKTASEAIAPKLEILKTVMWL